MTGAEQHANTNQSEEPLGVQIIRRLEAALAEAEQARAEADRLRETLREARGHLRPEIGGRFEQRAAVAVIDAALAGPQTKEQTT